MMRKSVAIGCVIFGLGLFYMGFEKTQSAVEGMAGTFLAGPWPYFIAGAVLFISGLGMLSGRKGKKR